MRPKPCRRLSQRLELPLLLEVDRVGDRTARDEQTVHLLQVVLQTVVVARKKTGSERRFQHVTLEFDLFADLQSAGRVENLHVGIVAHDLDDLGHHLGIPAVNVTDFVLADRASAFTITMFEMIPFTRPVVFIICFIVY